MALPVNFDADSAARIYRAVREVERGNRDQKPLTFRQIQDAPSRARGFRLATFTGQWNRETSRVVTFYNQTSTPNTVTAINPIFPCLDSSNNPGVLIAREGSAWYVINAVHGVTAVVTSAELGEDTLDFRRSNIQFVQSCTTVVDSTIALATCATAAQVSSQSLSLFLS